MKRMRNGESEITGGGSRKIGGVIGHDEGNGEENWAKEEGNGKNEKIDIRE